MYTVTFAVYRQFWSLRIWHGLLNSYVKTNAENSFNIIVLGRLVIPCTFILPIFVLINTMSCHVCRNVRLAMYQDPTVAFQGGLLSSNHQQHIDMVFSSRHGTVLTHGKDLEAAQDDRTSAGRGTVDLVVLDKTESRNSKESITEKSDA